MASTISVRPVIYEQYRRQDGTYPIRIRIIYKRYMRFLTTNLTARPEQLTKDLCIKDRRLREQVNSFADKLQDAANSLDPLVIQDCTIDDVVGMMNRVAASRERAFRLDFVEYAGRIMEDKPKNSRTNYMCALHSFCKYVGLQSFDISLITSSLMRGYELHLRNTFGNNARAVSLYPAAIAYIHRRAQAEFNNEELGDINVSNPFAHYKCPRQRQAAHRNFDESLISRMLQDRTVLSGRERYGVDVFLISFALMGMNAPDLYSCLKPKKGVITYERTKTRDRRSDNAEMKVRIEKCVENIISEYADDESVYLFNFNKRYRSYKYFSRAVNLGLSDYGRRIESEKPVTLYAARHTWASVAYSIGIGKDTINDCLCHVDPGMRVTDVYVQKDWRILWKANAKVLGRFDWSGPSGIVPNIDGSPAD